MTNDYLSQWRTQKLALPNFPAPNHRVVRQSMRPYVPILIKNKKANLRRRQRLYKRLGYLHRAPSLGKRPIGPLEGGGRK
jgi:prephenate dehydrogenase